MKDHNDAGDATERKVVRLDTLPDHIKDRYARLALVTCAEHVKRLDAADDDTLIVYCDWLLWQQAITAGCHAVHYELGLQDWPDDYNLDSTLWLRGNDWILDLERDPTVFHGVSLGLLFAPSVSMCLMNYYRMVRSLEYLIRRFRPREILFYDFSNDVSVLNAGERRRIVVEVAERMGVSLIDHSGAAEHILQRRVYWLPTLVVLKGILVFLYAHALDFATWLRTLFANRRKRVLILANTNISEPLAENYAGQRVTPVFMARVLPKRSALIWRCVKQGVRLVAQRSSRLSSADVRRVREIRRELETICSQPATGVHAAALIHVRSSLINEGKLEDTARIIVAAERLLDSVKPVRILVDGVRNSPPRIYIEMAHTRNIAVDYMWHSSLVPGVLKMEALGGDMRVTPRVDRVLTWGRIQEAWLDRVDSKQPRVRIGCPLGDRYAGKRWRPRMPPVNALVLQYTPNASDLKGLNVNMYEHFVDAVRSLRSMGFENIRMKLHPPGIWRIENFENIAKFFGLDVPIHQSEPFHEFMEWADVVIGPLPSGAMFETLAAGVPYHAFLLSPNAMDSSFYGDYPVLESIGVLPQTIRHDNAERAEKLLEALYSRHEIPNPSKRFWEVLAEDLA